MKKKFVTVVATVLMVVLAAVMLTACGGVTGKYTYKTKMSDFGADVGFEYDNMTISITIELKKDDKFSMSAKMTDVPDGMQAQADEMTKYYEKEGTYKIDGEKISLTVDDDTTEGTLKKGVLTISEGDMTMTFKK